MLGGETAKYVAGAGSRGSFLFFLATRRSSALPERWNNPYLLQTDPSVHGYLPPWPTSMPNNRTFFLPCLWF
jgi:hypothetical protein